MSNFNIIREEHQFVLIVILNINIMQSYKFLQNVSIRCQTWDIPLKNNTCFAVKFRK